MNILITGASGFVGNALIKHLVSLNNFNVIGGSRSSNVILPDGVPLAIIGDLVARTDLSSTLLGVDVVVHTAARVHIMREQALDSLREFRSVNFHGTLTLAEQAAACGVKRFIFISSIKVNGESTKSGFRYKASDHPAPQGAYGISKMEAEYGLFELSSRSGMEVVIIRPPLIYGQGVKANFALMVRFLKMGLPLPFGAINNQRSLVAVENLVDLISICLMHKDAAGKVFMISDNCDVSVSHLLRCIGAALNVPTRLVNVPLPLLRILFLTFQKQEFFERLCGSLQVNIDDTCQTLNWKPVIGLEDGLKKMLVAL